MELFIQQYVNAYQLGMTAQELSENLGIPVKLIYSRANDARRNGKLNVYLSRSHTSKVSQSEFIQKYMEAVINSKDYKCLAEELNITKNALKCRVYKLRKAGINLPKL
jgi:DNA-binding transcriptional regulator LsrR (DeoR family)